MSEFVNMRFVRLSEVYFSARKRSGLKKKKNLKNSLTYAL